MTENVQLGADQFQKLRDALIGAFPNRSRLEQMLFFGTGKELAQISPAVGNLRDDVYAVIRNALSYNWIADLVRAAYRDNPTHPLLSQFVAECFPQMLTPSEGGNDNEEVNDPLAACFLSPERQRVFLNRGPLRRAIKQLTAQEGIPPRILTIHSHLSRCGKTYSADFIRYCALQRGDGKERVAYIDLQQELALGYGLEDLIEMLGRKIQADLDTIPAQEAQVARWTRNLALWLIDRINRSGFFWWIVFDSINQVQALPAEIHEFIARLARELEVNDFDPSCRLVLISYNGREQLPLDIRQLVVQDDIRQEIGPSEIREFFEMQAQRLLGVDGAGNPIPGAAESAATITEVVQAKLQELSVERRPYAISSVVRDALVELEASLVPQEVEG